tara:strand:- start:108 stop:455 length:348 start_codon:yes stop_codon:yes gene_type:complete
VFPKEESLVMESKLYKFKEPWYAVERSSYIDELQKEIRFNPKHPLRGANVHAVAATSQNDDVLFEFEEPYNSEFQFVVVHLTWAAKETNPAYPHCEFYKDFEEFSRERMQPEFNE